MCVINHKIKMIIHLDKNHLNWIEDASVKDEMKSGKVTVQRALMPNQCPGGSKEDNIGILKNKDVQCCIIVQYQVLHTGFLMPLGLVAQPLQLRLPEKFSLRQYLGTDW